MSLDTQPTPNGGCTSVSRLLLELPQRRLLSGLARIDEALARGQHTNHCIRTDEGRPKVPEGISRQTLPVGGLNWEMITIRSSSPLLRTIAMISTATATHTTHYHTVRCARAQRMTSASGWLTINHAGLLGRAGDGLPHALLALVVLPIDSAQPQPFLPVHLQITVLIFFLVLWFLLQRKAKSL